MELSETIAALATPPGIGGIAVIRVSGPQAWEVVERLTDNAPLAPQQQAGQEMSSPPVHGGTKGGSSARQPNTAYFARLFEPPLTPPRAGGGKSSPPVHGGTKGGSGTAADTELIDEVILTFFRAPRSYTGEDVVEISSHGGRYAARRILELLFAHGARPARPGEFTERAFLNGKLDLAQAEAVADLIHARTRRAGQAAARQLAGGLSERVRAMRGRLLDLLALVELELDFSEEDVEFETREHRRAALTEIQGDLSALAATFQRGRLVREGLRVAIVGAPNAGKSTLLNALAQEERAIVSPEPGTTRDVVEAHLEVSGMELILQDTAGLREAAGFIEAEGILRTKKAIERSDLVLLLVDVSDPHWPEAETLELLRRKTTLLVWNKVDLSSGSPPVHGGIRGGLSPAEFRVSALQRTGIEELLQQIAQLMIGEDLAGDEIIVAEQRHHHALMRAIGSLEPALTHLQDCGGRESVLLAADLRDAINSLGEITGETVDEEILDRIFAKFCIGK